ncbi:MAG: ABC transporter ATP-binding protein [Pseudomonadota bacterium]
MLQLEVRKHLRDFEAAFDFSLSRDITVLLGPSGHGKTTFLNMVAGMTTPDAGYVILDGVTLFDSTRGTNVRMEQRKVGFVFQDYALFPHMSVYDNIAYGLRATGRKDKEVRAEVEQGLERMRIGELRDAKPSQLSGGQRQRVALARTLVTRPQIMLLDEPLSALDMQLRTAMRAELRTLLKTLEIPAVVVTHDPLDAVALGDDVIVIEEGRAVQRGTYESLLAAPRSRFVAEFVESNALSGTLESADPAEGATVLLAPGVRIRAQADVAAGPVTVVIHPWDISISTEAHVSSIGNVLAATVVGICPLRDRVRLLLDIGVPVTAEISRRSMAALDIALQSQVFASFKTTAVKIFGRH